MDIFLDKRFAKRVKGRFERFSFTVGVTDGPYRAARPKTQGLGTLQGGPVRRRANKIAGNITQVSNAMSARTNFYQKPFKKQNKDTKRFVNEFLKFITDEGGQRHRVVAYLRAVVRNPMLKGAYGSNTSMTARAKGFNRFMFDTGQLFRAIGAKIMRSSKNVS